jgi:hypothetical protein
VGEVRRGQHSLLNYDARHKAFAMIRLVDIPVFLITMALAIPLFLGFMELVKLQIIDIRGIPSWLFTVLFLGAVCQCCWVASLIWKRIKRFAGKA